MTTSTATTMNTAPTPAPTPTTGIAPNHPPHREEATSA